MSKQNWLHCKSNWEYTEHVFIAPENLFINCVYVSFELSTMGNALVVLNCHPSARFIEQFEPKQYCNDQCPCDRCLIGFIQPVFCWGYNIDGSFSLVIFHHNSNFIGVCFVFYWNSNKKIHYKMLHMTSLSDMTDGYRQCKSHQPHHIISSYDRILQRAQRL